MAPFDPDNDLTFRLIPSDSEVEHLHFIPGHFDVSSAEQDPNCLFPLDRLRELLAAGEIGKLADHHVSMGLTTELRKLKEQVSWEIAAAVLKTRPDIIVLTGG
jgi:D-proline reductase (dithiol) PrdB